MVYNKHINEYDRKRFDFDGDTHEIAIDYIKNRAIQMLRFGVEILEIQKYKEGVIGIFKYKNREHQYIYILKSHRNKNSYQKLHSLNGLPILVAYEDKIESYLRYKGYDYSIILIEDSNPYKTISGFFKNEKTSYQNKEFKMRHIDEGLAIMEWRKASKYARAAFCLHPMMQDDFEFKKHKRGKQLSLPDTFVPIPVIIAVMEFRSVANAYRISSYPKRKIKNIYDIKKGEINDVDEMLIADKVQDRKHFEIHGAGYVGDTEEHKVYFNNWLERLGVKEQDYQEYKKKLEINPKIVDNTKEDLDIVERSKSHLNDLKVKLGIKKEEKTYNYSLN